MPEYMKTPSSSSREVLRHLRARAAVLHVGMSC